MIQAVKNYGIGEGRDRSKEQWARTGCRQRGTLTGENVIEPIEIPERMSRGQSCFDLCVGPKSASAEVFSTRDGFGEAIFGAIAS